MTVLVPLVMSPCKIIQFIFGKMFLPLFTLDITSLKTAQIYNLSFGKIFDKIPPTYKPNHKAD